MATKRAWQFMLGISLVTASLPAFIPASALAADLAIIVDDIGYNLSRGNRILELPVPLTIAVLPFTPNAKQLAERANRMGKEVILHQPMEPQNRHGRKVPRGILTLDMPHQDFRSTFESALNAIPHCVGVNNHTGSLLTQNIRPMNWLMATLHERGLFFLDSRTTAQTVAFQAATDHQVPVLKRDVFLDHHLTTDAIDKAFKRALTIAEVQGQVVVIAHPHEKSIRYLERELPKLKDSKNIRLVTASQLLNRQTVGPTIAGLRQNLTFPHKSLGR